MTEKKSVEWRQVCRKWSNIPGEDSEQIPHSFLTVEHRKEKYSDVTLLECSYYFEMAFLILVQQNKQRQKHKGLPFIYLKHLVKWQLCHNEAATKNFRCSGLGVVCAGRKRRGNGFVQFDVCWRWFVFSLRTQANDLALLISRMQSNADQVEKNILQSEELLALVGTPDRRVPLPPITCAISLSFFCFQLVIAS